MSYNGTKIENLTAMAKILIEDFNVAVIPCDDFGFPDHIRLSYAISIDQIKKGLDRIEAFVNQLV
jgi:aspartate aminotransferase